MGVVSGGSDIGSGGVGRSEAGLSLAVCCWLG